MFLNSFVLFMIPVRLSSSNACQTVPTRFSGTVTRALSGPKLFPAGKSKLPAVWTVIYAPEFDNAVEFAESLLV